MEVKPGYKQTEAGLIPEEWDVRSFGDLFAFKNGVNADKEAYGKGVRFVNVLEPITYSHIHGPEIPGRVTLRESLLATYATKRGDVLFNRTSETEAELGLAATYVGTEQVVFGGFVIRGRPTDESFDPIYSGYALRAPVIRSQIIPMGQGAIRANIGQQSLSRVRALVPPLKEQRAIAKSLSDVDALLKGLDRLISKKQNLKQATMQQILTGLSRIRGFSGEWRLRRIGDFAACAAGGTPSTLVPEYWGGPISWMSSGELNFKRITEVEGRITDAGLRSSAAKMLPPKCVLIGLAGQGKTRGTVAINEIALCTNQSIAAVMPNAAFVSDYLYYNLDSRYDELRELSAGGGGRGGLNLTLIKSIQVPLPSISEQAAIAEVLTDMDAELVALTIRREKTRELKQAMMQQLLTGKTRLV